MSAKVFLLGFYKNMKILPIRPNYYRKPINTITPHSKNISFGIFNGYIPNDTQIYRCIGEEEYQKLINNESISSSGFVTTSPKGWAATNWNNGFIPYNKGSFNHYFITFKKGIFSKIADLRDSAKDTKHKIYEPYSLSDIENIRKGNNAHGELVWAENFEEEKAKDVTEKKQKISWLLLLLKSNTCPIDRNTIVDELLSYRTEFPEIEIRY